MANSDKNLVITPNINSSTGDPTIAFSGADASLGPQSLVARIYPTSNGTLSFEGSAGQLFSVTNQLTGTIFSVNDVSGLPSIEVLDTGVVRLARYSGRVLIGNINDNGNDSLQFSIGSSINLPTINSTGNVFAVRYTSNVVTGTAPFTVASTTRVDNLNVARAGTADVLTTARTINGVSFDGSANITITSNTPNALTFNNSGTGDGSGNTFNGSTARTISHNSIGAAATNQTMHIGTTSVAINRGSGALSLAGVSIDGNAGTATTLATARNINGVSFNGSANITITSNTTNALTFNNGGAGAASGTTFDGSTARTISHNSIGAAPLSSPNFTGTPSTDRLFSVGLNSNNNDVRIDVGRTRTIDGFAYVDFFSANGASSYNARLIRDGGVNGVFRLWQTGTGDLEIANIGNANITFKTNNNTKATIFAGGGFSVGTTDSPGAGAIYATGNITAYYSDERLKTRLGNIENALDKVCSLSGFYHEANEVAQSLGYSKIREVGVSAQEVQSVLPEVVAAAPIDKNYLTVRYERLVPLLIEAIKELKLEVDELKKRVQ